MYDKLIKGMTANGTATLNNTSIEYLCVASDDMVNINSTSVGQYYNATDFSIACEERMQFEKKAEKGADSWWNKLYSDSKTPQETETSQTTQGWEIAD